MAALVIRRFAIRGFDYLLMPISDPKYGVCDFSLDYLRIFDKNAL